MDKEKIEAAAKGSLVDSAVDTASDALKPAVEKIRAVCGPLFDGAQAVFVKVEPYLEIAYTEGHKFYVKIEPYRPEELLTFIIGFVLCFYGGAFCTTIAAVEAFRMSGYERCKKSFLNLKQQYDRAHEQLLKDVTQLSTDKLVKRKIKVALKTCDPEAVSEGFQ